MSDTPNTSSSLPVGCERFFRDKVVWVIGASDGLGAQISEDLLKMSAQLWVSARRLERLESLFPDVHVHKSALDVSDPQQVLDCIEKQPHLPDVVIFCAAIYEPGYFGDLALDTLLEHTRINYLGALSVCKALVDRHLRTAQPQRPLHLCLIGSVAGYRGMPRASAYNPNKAALKSFAECLALDAQLRMPELHVSIAEPGFIKTRLTDKNDFHMPFLLTVAQASQYTLKGIARERFEIRFPTSMVMALKFLSLLPFCWYKKLWGSGSK